MGFLTAFSRVVLDMTVVTLLILTLPGFPPYTTFSPVNFPSPPPWTGPLKANEKLNLVDRLFEGKIKGPESFAAWDGYLYTGLMSGLIVKIDPDDLSIEPVARIGSNCNEQHEESKCGRPLGMVFTKAGKLLVCDAVFGLYMLDLEKEVEENRIQASQQLERVEYTQLLPPNLQVDGKVHKVYNSIVLASDDETVYLTVSSTRFVLSDGVFEIVSDGSGRLVTFNLVTKKVSVLVEEINFANGLEMDPSENFLLFCETGMGRVHKHWLKGEKAGITEVLADNLPGMPDNIRLNDNGNYYIGLYPRIPGKPHIIEVLGPHNWVRKFLSRLVGMVMLPVKLVNAILPLRMTQQFEYWCGNLEPFAHLAPAYGLVVEIDPNSGDILSSLHSTNGAVRFIAEAFIMDRWIFFGSPYNNYLARIPKRLRYASHQKTSAGVTLGLLNDPEPSEAEVVEPKSRGM